MKKFMELAIAEARKTMNENGCRPYGAVIIDKDGNLISTAANTVAAAKDVSAHAEMDAIRKAQKVLGTTDLSGCVILATGHPCPMCMAAIILANIKTLYYGATVEDAEKAGIGSKAIYDFIKGECADEQVLKIESLERDACLELFDEYMSK